MAGAAPPSPAICQRWDPETPQLGLPAAAIRMGRAGCGRDGGCQEAAATTWRPGPADIKPGFSASPAVFASSSPLETQSKILDIPGEALPHLQARVLALSRELWDREGSAFAEAAASVVP